MSDPSERYVDGASQLDVDAIHADHQPDEDEVCRACDESWPCSLAWAADRVAGHREHRSRREHETPAPTGADSERT